MVSFYRVPLLIAATLLVSAFACSPKPASIAVTPPKAEIFDAGGTVQLTPTVQDKKGKVIPNAAVSYSSKNPAVAEVDDKGKVTARGTGATVIEVKCADISGQIQVAVSIVDSLKLQLAADGDSCAAGPKDSTYALRVTALNESRQPADLSKAKWVSSDPKIATVDGRGVLTLLSEGKTEVTVAIGKQSASLPVGVSLLTPMAIKLGAPSQTVNAGETAPLAFTVISNLGGPMTFPCAFELSDPTVATVDEKGRVTGLKRGATQVKIRAGVNINSMSVTVR